MSAPAARRETAHSSAGITSSPVNATWPPDAVADRTVTFAAQAGSGSPGRQFDITPDGSSGVTTVFSSLSPADASASNRTYYVTDTTPPIGSVSRQAAPQGCAAIQRSMITAPRGATRL